MTYLGNDLQVAYPTYRNIDDISGSFNGVTTSFALLVGGVAPVPLPLNSQQCLISVAGVVLRPDDTGTEGFRLSGGNIIFQSAPSSGADFFGVILAGADYINVGVNFPSGSAAVPSITFDSDLDTGVYNSAANNISITTGGTQRLVVDSSGRLGLGTSSPSYLLDVAGQARFGGANGLLFGVGNAFVANQGELYSVGTTPMGLGTTGSASLQFYTNSTERARIDSSGRLGLGTSSPQQELHINDATGISRIRLTGGAVGADNFEIGQAIPGVSNSGFSIYDVDVTASRFVIDSSGNVGIGTTAPSVTLDVSGSIQSTTTTANAGIQASSNAGNLSLNSRPDISAHTIDATINPLLIRTTAAQPLSFHTNSTERARIDSSGRLLVGTSTTSANSRIVIQGSSSDSTGDALLRLARGSSTVTDGDNLGQLIYTDSNHSGIAARIVAARDGGTWTSGSSMPGRLVFSTTADGSSSPTERMRIPNGGGLCIGSTVNPNALTQTSGIRLGGSTIASNDFINVTTTPVTIANGVGIGGMGFVQAYNTSTGAQYTGIIMWRSGVVVVVSESNALGFALTYSVSGSTLRLQTASGTVTGSIITLAS